MGKYLGWARYNPPCSSTDMSAYHMSRTTNVRILSAVIICTIAWIAIIIGNSCCCDPEQLQSPSPLPPPRPPHHTAPPKKLSQTLFPVLDPGKTDSWVGENSKMLQALFRCIELSNCGPNQQKGAVSYLRSIWLSCLPPISRHIGFQSFPSRALGLG